MPKIPQRALDDLDPHPLGEQVAAAPASCALCRCGIAPRPHNVPELRLVGATNNAVLCYGALFPNRLGDPTNGNFRRCR
jgi:hypothetical protein